MVRNTIEYGYKYKESCPSLQEDRVCFQESGFQYPGFTVELNDILSYVLIFSGVCTLMQKSELLLYPWCQRPRQCQRRRLHVKC